jgi:hypothetical protein
VVAPFSLHAKPCPQALALDVILDGLERELAKS